MGEIRQNPDDWMDMSEFLDAEDVSETKAMPPLRRKVTVSRAPKAPTGFTNGFVFHKVGEPLPLPAEDSHPS